MLDGKTPVSGRVAANVNPVPIQTNCKRIKIY